MNFFNLYKLTLEYVEATKTGEPSLNDIDKIFNDLLEQQKQAGAPVVAQTIIEQMTMIKEQLKKERELKNYQRLKLLMIEHIKELKAALGDDPKLIQAFNSFVNSYTKNKNIQLQEAEGLKEKLEDEMQNTRLLWIKISRNLGAFKAGEYATRGGDFQDQLQHIMRDLMPDQRASVSGFIRFIKKMEQVLPGYDWIDLTPPKAEMDQFLNFISDLITKFQAELVSDMRYKGSQSPELTSFKQKQLDELISNTENLSKTIRNISAILNTVRSLIKKTELSSLSEFNKIGQEEDAENIAQHCYVIDKTNYEISQISSKQAQQIRSNKDEYTTFKRSMGGWAMEFNESSLLICLAKKVPYFYIDLYELSMHVPGKADVQELLDHVKQNNWDIVKTKTGTVYNAEESLLVVLN